MPTDDLDQMLSELEHITPSASPPSPRIPIEKPGDTLVAQDMTVNDLLQVLKTWPASERQEWFAEDAQTSRSDFSQLLKIIATTDTQFATEIVLSGALSPEHAQIILTELLNWEHSLGMQTTFPNIVAAEFRTLMNNMAMSERTDWFTNNAHKLEAILPDIAKGDRIAALYILTNEDAVGVLSEAQKQAILDTFKVKSSDELLYAIVSNVDEYTQRGMTSKTSLLTSLLPLTGKSLLAYFQSDINIAVKLLSDFDFRTQLDSDDKFELYKHFSTDPNFDKLFDNNNGWHITAGININMAKWILTEPTVLNLINTSDGFKVGIAKMLVSYLEKDFDNFQKLLPDLAKAGLSYKTLVRAYPEFASALLKRQQALNIPQDEMRELITLGSKFNTNSLTVVQSEEFMDENQKTPYEILNVPSDASQEIIDTTFKQAFKKLSEQTASTKLLSLAYLLVKDPVIRAQTDWAIKLRAIRNEIATNNALPAVTADNQNLVEYAKKNTELLDETLLRKAAEYHFQQYLNSDQSLPHFTDVSFRYSHKGEVYENDTGYSEASEENGYFITYTVPGEEPMVARVSNQQIREFATRDPQDVLNAYMDELLSTRMNKDETNYIHPQKLEIDANKAWVKQIVDYAEAHTSGEISKWLDDQLATTPNIALHLRNTAVSHPELSAKLKESISDELVTATVALAKTDYNFAYMMLRSDLFAVKLSVHKNDILQAHGNKAALIPTTTPIVDVLDNVGDLDEEAKAGLRLPLLQFITTNDNPYSVLGIEITATRSQIDQAYAAKSASDVVAHTAYEYLCDPAKKTVVDETLANMDFYQQWATHYKQYLFVSSKLTAANENFLNPLLDEIEIIFAAAENAKNFDGTQTENLNRLLNNAEKMLNNLHQLQSPAQLFQKIVELDTENKIPQNLREQTQAQLDSFYEAIKTGGDISAQQISILVEQIHSLHQLTMNNVVDDNFEAVLDDISIARHSVNDDFSNVLDDVEEPDPLMAQLHALEASQVIDINPPTSARTDDTDPDFSDVLDDVLGAEFPASPAIVVEGDALADLLARFNDDNSSDEPVNSVDKGEVVDRSRPPRAPSNYQGSETATAVLHDIKNASELYKLLKEFLGHTQHTVKFETLAKAKPSLMALLEETERRVQQADTTKDLQAEFARMRNAILEGFTIEIAQGQGAKKIDAFAHQLYLLSQWNKLLPLIEQLSQQHKGNPAKLSQLFKQIADRMNQLPPLDYSSAEIAALKKDLQEENKKHDAVKLENAAKIDELEEKCKHPEQHSAGDIRHFRQEIDRLNREHFTPIKIVRLERVINAYESRNSRKTDKNSDVSLEIVKAQLTGLSRMSPRREAGNFSVTAQQIYDTLLTLREQHKNSEVGVQQVEPLLHQFKAILENAEKKLETRSFLDKLIATGRHPVRELSKFVDTQILKNVTDHQTLRNSISEMQTTIQALPTLKPASKLDKAKSAGRAIDPALEAKEQSQAAEHAADIAKLRSSVADLQAMQISQADDYLNFAQQISALVRQLTALREQYPDDKTIPALIDQTRKTLETAQESFQKTRSASQKLTDVLRDPFAELSKVVKVNIKHERTPKREALDVVKAEAEKLNKVDAEVEQLRRAAPAA